MTSRTEGGGENADTMTMCNVGVEGTEAMQTARMVKATENDVGLQQPVSPPTPPPRYRRPCPVKLVTPYQKICTVFKTHRFVGYTTDCKGGARRLSRQI